MNIPLIPSREAGNSWYPLVPDYPTLTPEGRRQARIAACRQWLIPAPRLTQGLRFAECVRFFLSYYLTHELDSDGNIVFDPLFVSSEQHRPAPAFHSVVHAAALANRKTAFVGPRGSAKSKGIFAPIMMLGMLSRPLYDFTYATSTNDLAQEMGDNCKYQLYENQRICDDWGPEYDGRTKPFRGEGRSGMGAFVLSNRSSFFATSAQSRQRGKRPMIYCLDDPEWDAKHSTSVEVLAEGTASLLFDVALPMVQQSGTHLLWGGTFISLRHYLWQAMSVELSVINGVPVEKAIEPKFSTWKRIIIPAAHAIVDPLSGKERLESCWPHMWPIDTAERERLGVPEDTQTLDDVRADIGEDRFQTEMMANPGQGKGAYFPPLTREDHWFWPVESSIDTELFTSPRTSRAVLEFLRKKGSTYTTIHLPLSDLLSRFPRFIVCDASDTASRTSDRKTSFCFCLTDANELLLLDAWSDQCEEDVQIDEIFRMGDKWLVSVVHPEDIKSGKHLKEALLARVQTRASDVQGVEHLAVIGGFNPGQTDKPTKIKAGKWRFVHGKIKLPWHLRDEPALKRLVHQLANFHPYADDGGLAKDDEIDTAVAMPSFVLKSIPSTPARQDVESQKSSREHLLEGTSTDKTGMPYLATALHTMSSDDVDAALAAANRMNTPKPHNGSLI